MLVLHRQDHLRTQNHAKLAAKLAATIAAIGGKEAELATFTDPDQQDAIAKDLAWLRGQARWMADTVIEIIVSEGQNEAADFRENGESALFPTAPA